MISVGSFIFLSAVLLGLLRRVGSFIILLFRFWLTCFFSFVCIGWRLFSGSIACACVLCVECRDGNGLLFRGVEDGWW